MMYRSAQYSHRRHAYCFAASGVVQTQTIFLAVRDRQIHELARRSLAHHRKSQLYFLFSLGFFIGEYRHARRSLPCIDKATVAITIVRLPQNANHATAQVNRTTWASAELLTASFVANAPALYTLCKRKEEPDQQRPASPIELTPMTKDTSASSEKGPSSSHHEFQGGRDARTQRHGDLERGTEDSDADSRRRILVTSHIDTQSSPMSQAR
jgi:hypothetical protein